MSYIDLKKGQCAVRTWGLSEPFSLAQSQRSPRNIPRSSSLPNPHSLQSIVSRLLEGRRKVVTLLFQNANLVLKKRICITRTERTSGSLGKFEREANFNEMKAIEESRCRKPGALEI
jgi:hypothetical protein